MADDEAAVDEDPRPPRVGHELGHHLGRDLLLDVLEQLLAPALEADAVLLAGVVARQHEAPLQRHQSQRVGARHHERHGTERVDDGQDREQRTCRVAEIRSEPSHVRTLAGR